MESPIFPNNQGIDWVWFHFGELLLIYRMLYISHASRFPTIAKLIKSLPYTNADIEHHANQNQSKETN